MPVPSPPPDVLSETQPPVGHRLLFEGLITGPAKGAFGVLTPGVFLSLPPFPIEIEGELDRYNPLGLPEDVRERIAAINPEIRMWGTDRGVAIERRGWRQEYLVRSGDGNCAVMLDFRVDVVERALASDSTFGRIRRPFELVKILVPPPPGRSGIYVLVIVRVEVNSKLFGKRFEETNTAITNARAGQQPALTSVVNAMPRWFVVEHELLHAEQIRRAYRDVISGVITDHRLCNPTRPVDQHKALTQAGFNSAWTQMTTGGAGGDHSNPNYPNTPAETEAREAAWALFDARGGR